MTKAVRMMEDTLKLVDGVIFVVDARCPVACINKNLLKMFENKKVLYILNKADLIEKADLNKYIKYFTENFGLAVGACGTDLKYRKVIFDKATFMLSEKLLRNDKKGLNSSLKIMVAGIPNTGKSSIINTLCGEKRAVTGDKAGVTKGKQWIRAGAFDLLDTPGTMPPSFDNQNLAKHLAFIGSINDSILDFSDMALELLKELKETAPLKLSTKYGVELKDKEPLEIYEAICGRRGYLFKGGEFDYERCGKAVIDDFRKGRIGKIALDII
jgi:ribosome biogenesis GTPase A